MMERGGLPPAFLTANPEVDKQKQVITKPEEVNKQKEKKKEAEENEEKGDKGDEAERQRAAVLDALRDAEQRADARKYKHV